MRLRKITWIDSKNLNRGDQLVVFRKKKTNWMGRRLPMEFINKFRDLSVLHEKEVIFWGNDILNTGCFLVKLKSDPTVFTVHRDFLRIKEDLKVNLQCKCDVFVTGCICGFFQENG